MLYRCRYRVDLRKLTCNNTNLDLVNAYAKCGEIPFICPQNIERKQNSDSSQEGERGGSVVECRTPERDLPPPCCVLEQDTLLPESTG